MDTVRESTVERRFVKLIEDMGGDVVKVRKRDWPDRLCLFGRGVHFFVELKRPGEKPTPRQLRRHALLRADGHWVYVHDGTDWETLLLVMRKWVRLLAARSAHKRQTKGEYYESDPD